MKKIINIIYSQRRAFALLCVFFSLKGASQVIHNLVNNYSGEQFSSCPLGTAQIFLANKWFRPTLGGTSDYFNTCATATSNVAIPNNFFGSQMPRTGNAYFGGAAFEQAVEGREDIECGLKQTLKYGKSYCVTFYVSLAEYSRYAISNIGAYFAKDSLKNYWPFTLPNNFFLVPSVENPYTNIITDTLNWIQIQSTYAASGVENFITIGNFRNDINTNQIQVKPLFNNTVSIANTAYYYYDDISVLEINSSNAYIKDSLLICQSDSVILGTDSTEFATYTWQSTAAGLAALSCTNCPNPIAKPQVTTKYYLTKVQCSATTMDSVLVVVKTPTTIANAGTNQLICEGDIIQIGTQDSLAYTSYNWLPTTGLSCTNCATPYANPNATTIYNLTRKECNVTTTSTVKITIDDCNPTYTVPNVFTPNYDGVNDTWGVTFSSVKYIKNFQLQIYDRWGLLIYQTNSGYSTPNVKWDGHTMAGNECTNGVYYYIISFDKNDEKVELKGTINLFR